MEFSIIIYFLFLYLLGNVFRKMFELPFKYSLPIGYLAFLAIFQIISLPIMLMKGSFNEVLIVFGLTIMIGVGLIINFRRNIELKFSFDFEILSVILSTLVMVLLMLIYNNNGNLADDFFYKSLYLDTLSAENVFTYAPKEGDLFESFPYMYRINSFDLIPSVLSKLSNIHSTALVMWIISPFHFIIFFLTVLDLLRIINKDRKLCFVIFGLILFHSFYLLDDYIGDSFSPFLPSTYLVYLMYSGKFVYFYIILPLINILLILIYRTKNKNLYWAINLAIIVGVSLNTTSIYLSLFLIIAIIFTDIIFLKQPIRRGWLFTLCHLLLWALLILYLRFNSFTLILLSFVLCALSLYLLMYINKQLFQLAKNFFILLVCLFNFLGIIVSLLFDDGLIDCLTFIRKFLFAFKRYPFLYLIWILITIYILFGRKTTKEERLVFGFIPLILVISFFNPFSTGIISLITTPYTYNRILWIIPIIFILCIYLKDTIVWVLDILHVRNKNIKKISSVLGVFLLIFSSKEWLYDISYWGKYYNKNKLNFYYDLSHDLINMSIYFEKLETSSNVLPFAHEAYYNLRKLTSSVNYVVDVNTYQGQKSSSENMKQLISDLSKNFLDQNLWNEIIETNPIDYIILETSSDLIWQFKELRYNCVEFGRFTIFRLDRKEVDSND